MRTDCDNSRCFTSFVQGYERMVTAGGAPEKARPSKRLLLFAFATAWGPGIVVGIILYLLTGIAIVGGLAFMIVTAVSAVVLGAVGSRRMKRHADR